MSIASCLQAQEYDAYSNNPYNSSSYSITCQNQQAIQNKKSMPAKNVTQQKKEVSSGDTQNADSESQLSSCKENETDKKESHKQEQANKFKKEEEKLKSPHTFIGNVSLVSDYRFRGISQTMRRPAIQGGFDYSHISGLYLGTWASNVDGTTHFYNNTSMEWDFYGGYKGKFFPCLSPELVYNIGLIYYYYPGGKSFAEDSVRYNTAEFYFELVYKYLSVKYWQTLTNYFGIESDNPPFNWHRNRADQSHGNSKGSVYIEANATFDLYQKMYLNCSCLTGGKLTLVVHIGHQTVKNYRHLSYTDWRVTLMQEFDWFNPFFSYVGTNARHAYFDVPDNTFHSNTRYLGAQGVVFGIIRTF